MNYFFAGTMKTYLFIPNFSLHESVINHFDHNFDIAGNGIAYIRLKVHAYYTGFLDHQVVEMLGVFNLLAKGFVRPLPEREESGAGFDC